MNDILSVVLDTLDSDEWRYSLIEDEPGNPVITLDFKGRNGHWSCYIKIRDTQLAVLSSFPAQVPPKTMSRMAMFIAMANSDIDLGFGCFMMNCDKGDILFKNGIDVTDFELTQSMVTDILTSNMLCMDRFFHALMSVIYSTDDLKSILAKCEIEDEDDEEEEEEVEYS